MRHVRDVMSELVERRLWPVAALLALALVAVPVLLAKPAPHAAADPQATAAALAAANAAAPASADQPVVTLDADRRISVAPRGRAKNPFVQQRKDASSTDAGASAGAASPASGDTGAGVAPGAGTPVARKPDSAPTYQLASVDLRFGKAVGPLDRHRDLPRLSPLPNAAHPLVIFLGMRKDLKSAVFLLSSDVHASGDGTCTPSRKECTTVELQEGDTAFFDVTGSDGRVTQYELDLTAIHVTQTSSKSDADAAYARVSRAGARLFAHRGQASADANGRRVRIPYRYAPARGVLHIAPFLSRRVGGRPHAAGATTAVHAVAAP